MQVESILEMKREEAKRIVRAQLFRGYQDNTGENSAVQQRLHERKILMAFNHVQGLPTSELLSTEAQMRGLTIDALAAAILAKAAELNTLELERVRINIAIDACQRVSDIGKLMIDERIDLPPGIRFHDPIETPQQPSGPAVILPQVE